MDWILLLAYLDFTLCFHTTLRELLPSSREVNPTYIYQYKYDTTERNPLSHTLLLQPTSFPRMLCQVVRAAAVGRG